MTPTFMKPQVQLFTVDPKTAGLAPSIRTCVCCGKPARPEPRWIGAFCGKCRDDIRARLATSKQATPEVSA